VKTVHIVSATRLDAYTFGWTAPLGLSLQRLAFDTRLTSSVVYMNSEGLPRVFNAQITEANRSKILLFIHDDVWIDDFLVVDRLLAAMDSFDVVGVAGNTRRGTRQPTWWLVDEELKVVDEHHLTGAIGHGPMPCIDLCYYGPSPRACRLLDGVFLAVSCDVLLDRGVAFDARFPFHFYDMDFCRTAEERGLRLGSWPIAITHVSGGRCGTPPWWEARAVYLEKWPD
jgi:GT2 family glycosyltransferase